jgi:hypothetical protein
MRNLLWSPMNSGSYPHIELRAARPFAFFASEAALVAAGSQSELKARTGVRSPRGNGIIAHDVA